MPIVPDPDVGDVGAAAADARGRRVSVPVFRTAVMAAHRLMATKWVQATDWVIVAV
jgi:hypothetical protein